MRKLLSVLPLLLVVVPSVTAHDYWLLPETFFPAAADPVAIRLHVGEDLVSEAERPFQKKATTRFDHLGSKGKENLAADATDGKTPVARLTLKTAGTHLLVMDRGVQTIKLEAEKFNKYLADEGLDGVLEERRKAGEDKTPGRERYTRYLKTLIQVGDAPDDTAKEVVKQKLEIVPQANPYGLKPGEPLKVQILFDGKPLAGARVFGQRRSGEKTVTQTATTAAEGMASFKVDGEGTYLIHLVHMRRCANDPDNDWESFWGALTFGRK